MQMYQHVESGAHETKIFGVLSGLSIFSLIMIPGMYSATVPDTDANMGPRYDYMLVNVEGAQIGSVPREAKINTLFAADSWKLIFASDADTLIIDPHCSLHSSLCWMLVETVGRSLSTRSDHDTNNHASNYTSSHALAVECSFLNIAKTSTRRVTLWLMANAVLQGMSLVL